MSKHLFTLVLAVLLCLAPLSSQEGGGGYPGGPTPFRLDLALDGALLGTAASLGGAMLYLESSSAAGSDPYDGAILDASAVNAVDRLLMSPYSADLDALGTGLELASVLLPGILLATPSTEWPTLGAMYAETMLMAYGLKELGKAVVTRARPYLYYSDPPQEASDEGDLWDSFPSGHSTLAFAGATFASYTFCQYFPDSDLRIPVIATSYALALATAASRVASGSHFLSDVVAGAVLGGACGFLVPWLHSYVGSSTKASDKEASALSVQALPLGVLVSLEL